MGMTNTHIANKPSDILLLYIGTVSLEENIEDFLNLRNELGRKMVLGDGPDKAKLQAMYSHIPFSKIKESRLIHGWLSFADVIVFPSKTHVSRTAMLAASSAGTPIAAYPNKDTLAYVVDHLNGVVNDNLEVAVIDACTLDRKAILRDLHDRQQSIKGP